MKTSGMRSKITVLQAFGIITLFTLPICLVYAKPTIAQQINAANSQLIHAPNPVIEQAEKEKQIPLNYVGIAFHKPTYVLPFYYTGAPANNIYANQTPNNESLKSTEVKYQLSLKVPIWKDILDYDTSFYFAYTQLSYWQIYNKTSFIRETDYEPEFFFANTVNYPLYKCWELNFFNLGYIHQSNGVGNGLQRSWDRLYIEAITSIDNWMISLKPWYIIARNSKNENISNYLGYASLLFSYKFNDQVFAFQLTNLGATPNRTSANLTWSFPLTPYIKGYAELFSGYGQSLVEYNHHTNSAGIGFALSDWA